MSHRSGLIHGCIVGAVLSAATLVSTDAFAQCCQGGSATGANMFTDGLSTSAQWPAEIELEPGMVIGKGPAVEPQGWWTHGELEVGGRDFISAPPADGSGAVNANVAQQGGNLAKYYEYSIVAPGAFGGGHIAAGSKDGVYQVDLWANNVGSYFAGFSDQSYLLTASKIGPQGEGNQFFSASWDETPHVYSTTAQTPYLGVGSAALTLSPGAFHAGFGAPIVPYLNYTDLGIERDTAAVSYRAVDAWTAWDARVDYSHMTRTGTQIAGIPDNISVPLPVNDVTQNFGANGEYLGTSPWGQKFTLKVAYNGSIYTDNISNFTVQAPITTIDGATIVRESTWPSNAANGASETTTADLPFNSRYVGTTSFIMMTQNAAFQPMTDNPLAVASPNGVPWNQVGALPASSLSGDINTLLSNNVITTKITPYLTSKLSYRYYDFDNQTPRIIQPEWVGLDGAAPGCPGPNCTLSSLSIGYVKQDAGAELNWRPTREWNLNAAYGYEHYDYSETDAGFTNENSVKLSADWKPTGWLTARMSGSYADRTAGDYSYLLNVFPIQYPVLGGGVPFPPTTDTGYFYSSAYQQFMFDNRQRTKADFLLDLVVLPGVTITPSVKFKNDYYGINPVTQEGLNDQTSISTGVDLGWVVTRDLSFTFSYYWEDYNQLLYNYTNMGFPPPYGTSTNSAAPGTCVNGGVASAAGVSNCLITTTDREFVNTVTAAVRWAAIPNTLDLEARYAYSAGIDQTKLQTAASNVACVGCIGAFPNDTTTFQRLDLTATYKFDPSWVHQMGFRGDILARLRYTWESNSVNNWQNDPLAPYTDIPALLTTSLWLASDNPNYNVQMIAASLVARW